MNRNTTLALALLVVGLFVMTAMASDIVILRNQIVQGEIVAEDDKSVTIKTEDGKEEKIRRTKVEKIVRDQNAADYLRAEFSALDPRDVNGQGALAILAVRSGQHEVGREFNLKILETDPTNAQAGRALGFVLQDGKWVAPPESANKDAPAISGAPKNTVAIEVSETIDDKPWKEFLLSYPNPSYRDTVGSQLAGSLFYQGHSWGVLGETATAAERDNAPFLAKIELKAKQTRTTTWMTQRMQVFYEATVEIKVIRRSDDKCVLFAKCTLEKGHHDEGSAVRNAFLKAATEINKNQAIAESPLWSDPSKAPEVKKAIIVAASADTE